MAEFSPKFKEALSLVQKPGRYTGGEPGCVYKEKEKLDLRFAFCFPDTYEVGMSFLGMKILYEILNKRDNIWCERVFMPWVDMKEQMQQQMAEDDGKMYWVDNAEVPEWNFDKITDEASFYLDSDGHLVICFNEGDVAPMYMGCVQFVIPDEVVADIRK